MKTSMHELECRVVNRIARIKMSLPLLWVIRATHELKPAFGAVKDALAFRMSCQHAVFYM